MSIWVSDLYEFEKLLDMMEKHNIGHTSDIELCRNMLLRLSFPEIVRLEEGIVSFGKKDLEMVYIEEVN